MNWLTQIFEQLPKTISAIKTITEVAPAAVGTIKELTAFVHRVIGYLKQEVPLTPEQDAELDRLIEEMKDQPHWQSRKP